MKHYILMCDIIGSGKSNQVLLLDHFKKCTKFINQKYSDSLLSPLTITLGDEFQGVVKNINDSIKIVIEIEEFIIKNNFNIKLRYIVNYGTIDTKINHKVAYEMMGEGLTNARVMINNMKKSSIRFKIKTDDIEITNIINNSLIIYQHIIDNWNIAKDYKLISNFLKFKDYKIVAENLKKERSLIWKREKSLNLSSYYAVKEILENVTRL